MVAKVEFHFGELFPRVGFIVTNLETGKRRLSEKKFPKTAIRRSEVGGL